jgi:hypothetical protein
MKAYPTTGVAAETEILTVIEVWNRFEGQTVSIQWPWSEGLPRRVPTGKQVEFRVDEDPGSHRIAQSAAKRVWRKHCRSHQ